MKITRNVLFSPPIGNNIGRKQSKNDKVRKMKQLIHNFILGKVQLGGSSKGLPDSTSEGTSSGTSLCVLSGGVNPFW